MPSRQPSKGEVTLSVQAIGLNRAELMFMHGRYLEPTRLPATLGYEASGIVTVVGADVDSGWLNRTVSTVPAFSANQYGALGSEVIVPVGALAEYPPHLTPIEGTSIWVRSASEIRPSEKGRVRPDHRSFQRHRSRSHTSCEGRRSHSDCNNPHKC